mgnify:CR=1 FL=1
MAWIAKHADLANAQTIDIGCGGGILSESLAKAGALVTGLDMASDSIEIARTHAQAAQLNIDYQISTAEAWAQAHPAEYEVVTCMELLEHVPDPASVVHAAAQLLAPNGIVFFSTINRNPKSYLFAIIGAEYVLRMLAKGTHDYHKFIKPSELAHDIRSAGLQLKDMTGLHYNPLTKRYWLAPNVDVNYMAHTVNEGA